MNGRVVLRPGKEKPVRRRHPWVFSGAVRCIEGEPKPGAVVEVVSAKGEWLAWAEFNPRSQIRARAFCWEQGAVIDEAFWRMRLAASIERRRQLLPDVTTCRLIFAESDGVPGLIVDRYGAFLVMQCLTAGADARKDLFARLLHDLLSPAAIVERDDPVRRKEGLAPAQGVLSGELPDAPIIISENGHDFLVDLRSGQKTGFFLDQADNRARLAPYCAGKEVLNAFSYTGAFAVYALASGARHVVNLDVSAEALDVAVRNFALNGFAPDRWENVQGDAFRQMRVWRDQGRQFDLIVLDPPKFAASRRHIERAARGYKDINWLAMRLLRPNGLLATFSCSGLVSADLFQKIVFGAALDAGREVRIIERFHQRGDHPALLTFPEAAYLKGLLCHVA
ncbi:MAG: 23S rRNA (cytosine(1962)-C(5))-methyltransferase RlmI [Chloroflexi bacterium]|nr:23S rRNA (cytosine(1962)-C(5))-methyltransferase RlmI [Chloroflexota bacterium]